MVRVPVFFNQFVLSSLLMPLYFIVIMVVSGSVGVSQATDAGMDPVDLLEMARSLTALLTFDNPRSRGARWACSSLACSSASRPTRLRWA